MPKISLIVPVYKSEEYLEKCLDSLVKQSLEDVEILLVNDGSPDQSQEIMDRYQKEYSHKIRCFLQENKGQGAARNLGLRQAEGEYVFFVDSDDYLDLSACQKVYDFAQSTKADVVCFPFYQVKDGRKEETEYQVFFPEEADVRYVLNETSPWNKLIKRSLLVENNLFFSEGRIYEDLELIPQLALYTKNIAFFKERIYYYVIRQGSTMRQTSYNAKLSAIYPVMDTLKEKFGSTSYQAELEYLYIEHLLHSAVLRYLQYPEGKEDIKKIHAIMKERFPRWQKNPYYQKMGFKYKIVCNLAYRKQSFLLKKLLKVK